MRLEARDTTPAHPFPGLRPFHSDEEHLFFGRDEQTAELVTRLRESRFLAVVGTSGSGKSSLVRAGLIPRLLAGRMRKVGSSWEVAVMRPGGRPATHLAEALCDANLYDREAEGALANLRVTLGRSRLGLVEAVRQSDVEEDTNVLVVVDQFEEIFRFRSAGTREEEQAHDFVSLLLEATARDDIPIYVAITMRSDFIGDCAQFTGLAEAVNRGEYLIPRLGREQCRAVVEGPVRVAGGEITPQLVQRVLNDLGADQDQLPVLQHALMRTWDHWQADHAEGEPIDLRHYRATGGVNEALSRHAEEVHDELPDDRHRLVCERLFKALTQRGADNRGIRRPTSVGRLAEITGAGEAELQAVLGAFRRPGRTFLMPERVELSPETIIDLSHESLMRVWKRLDRWVGEEAQSSRIYARLAETARLHRDGRAGLYRDPDLQIALSWRHEAQPNATWAAQYGGDFETAMAFLDASRKDAEAEERRREELREKALEQANALAEAERLRAEEHERAAKRLRVLAAGVAVVALVAIIASVLAILARKAAVESADLAEQNRRDAVASARLASEKERTASELAAELQQILVGSDYRLGAQGIEKGNGAEGLSFLARALRTDPTFWPAAARGLSALASGRFLPAGGVQAIEHERVISSYRFNGISDLLFTSDYEASVPNEAIHSIWDLRTGQRLYRLNKGQEMAGVMWTADGSWLFAHLHPEKATTIQAWEGRTGERVGRPIPYDHGDLSGYKLTPARGAAERRVLVRHDAWALEIWNPNTGEPTTPRIRRVAPLPNWPAYDFTPDGRRFWAFYTDGVITVREVDGGDTVAEFSTAGRQVSGVVASHDSRTIGALDRDRKQLNWWHLDRENAGNEWLEFETPVTAYLLSSGRRVAVLGGGEARPPFVEVFDLDRGLDPAPESDRGHRGFVVRVESDRQAAKAIIPLEEGRIPFPLVGMIEGHAIRIWDLNTGSLLSEIVTPGLLFNAVFSPEGRRLITVSRDNDVMIWDLFTSQPLFSEPIEHEGVVSRWAFSPDGEKFVTHDSVKRVVQVWDTRTGRQLLEPIAQGVCSNILFTSDRNRLLLWETTHTRYSDGSNRRTTGRFNLVDLETRQALSRPLFDSTGVESSALFTPDGEHLVVVRPPQETSPAEVLILDATTHAIARSVTLPQGISGANEFKTFQLSSDSRRVLLGCSDSRLRIWEIESGELVHELLHGALIWSVAQSRDGTRIATGTADGKVQVWNASTGAALGDPWQQGDQLIWALSFSPDDSLLASGSGDFKFRLVDARTGEAKFEPLEFNNIIEACPFSPDGRYVAVVSFDGVLQIISADTGETLQELSHSNHCRIAVFAPDGETLAVGTGGSLKMPTGEVYLWDWRAGTQVSRPLKAGGAVGRLAFSRDGKLLVTGTVRNVEGSTQVWHLDGGRPLTEPFVGPGALSSVAFDPAGGRVVAAWSTGSVKLIDLPPRTTPPVWLPRLFEVVAGQRLVESGAGIEKVSPAARESLEREIESMDRDDSSPYIAWAKWFFADPGTRAASPGSTMTRADYVRRLLGSKQVADLQEALKLSPAHGLAHARMGLQLLENLSTAKGGPSGAVGSQPRELNHGEKSLWKETAAWYSRKATELAPEDSEVWALHADLLRKLERDAEAEEAAARAVELDLARGDESSSANAWLVHAEALAAAGRWDDADEAFAKSLERVAASRTPLIGVLERLTPSRTAAGFDIQLGDPIPGTFEDFESTPEGRLPEGWTSRHEIGFRAQVFTPPASLSLATSDAFADWTVVSTGRAAGWTWETGRRTLDSTVAGRRNGRLVSHVLRGKFVYALSDLRPWSQLQCLTTPDFDCSGRTGIHVVFGSAYEQREGSFAALEYSIDSGATWRPVFYRVSAGHVVLDAAGRVDAMATLERRREILENIASLPGEDGMLRSEAYAGFIGVPVGPELAPFIQGRRNDGRRESKRIEVHRLPAAAGQSQVRLRFTLAAREGWYWGLDDFGLYEIPGARPPSPPGSLDLATEPFVLAGLGLATALGTAPRNGMLAALRREDFAGVTLTLPPFVKGPEARPSTPATPPAPVSAGSLATLESESVRRQDLIDAQLLVRRARSLAGDDPWIRLAVATVFAHAGEPEAATAAMAGVLEQRPLDRYAVRPLTAVLISRGDALKSSGDIAAASVCYELALLLHEAVGRKPDPRINHRLVATGQVAENEMLVSSGSKWRYLDTGEDLGPQWREIDFEDTSWPIGQARLGYGNDGERTIVRFGSDSTNKHVTTYFRAIIEIEDPERFTTLKIRLQRDDGIVVYLNGQEVARDNLPAGEVTSGTWALTAIANDLEREWLEFDAASGALRRGKNVLAAEIHQATATSSDIGFDLELEGIAGLKVPTRETGVLAALERQLELPDVLRGLLWTSRAARLRSAGDLERAEECLERAAGFDSGSPAIRYQQALLLEERGDGDAAQRVYLQSVEGARQLKSSQNSHVLLLPESLKNHIEPLVETTGLGLAYAAARLTHREAECDWLLRQSEALDGKGVDAAQERARALLGLGRNGPALEATDAALKATDGDSPFSPRAVRRQKSLLELRERCLRVLGRTEEADRVRNSILHWPARNPALSPKLIDLSSHYTRDLSDRYSKLPETYRPRDGIEFDLRGVVQLNSGIFPPGTSLNMGGRNLDGHLGRTYPYEATDIKVNQQVKTLHLLAATLWGEEPAGTEIAYFVIHYADDTRVEFALRYKEDVVDFHMPRGHYRELPPDRIVWRSEDSTTILCLTSWENPHPDKKIQTIDFISARKAAAPFMVALTVESPR